MGIQGLLRGLKPLLKSNNPTALNRKSNIRQFAQKNIAIDASSWLHKAGYACAERLVESIKNKKEDSECIRIYTSYMIKRCEELLINANIKTIILVFDGKRCPLKAETNLEREQKREKNIADARRLKSKGMHLEASEKYRSCVKVTDTMASNVAKAVNTKFGNAALKEGVRVQCIFSPYEADAQLAQLCFDRTADAVVTEDSDIILYSVTCGMPFPIIYKLDRDTGSCDIIAMTWLLSQKINTGFDSNFGTEICSKSKSVLAGILRFIAFNERRKTGVGRRMFVQACILSGCDYSPSMPGIGLITAFKMIKEFSNKNPDDRFHHIVRAIKAKMETKTRKDKHLSPSSTQLQTVSFDFKTHEIRLSKSEAAFYYHLVWRGKDNSIDHFLLPDLQKKDRKHELDYKDHLHCNLPSTNHFRNDLSFLGMKSSVINNVENNALLSRNDIISSRNHTVGTNEKNKRKLDSFSSKRKILCDKGDMRKRSPEKKRKSITTWISNIQKSNIDKEKKPLVSEKKSSPSLIPANNNRNYNPFSKFSFYSKTVQEREPGLDVYEFKRKSTKEDEEVFLISESEQSSNPSLDFQAGTKTSITHKQELAEFVDNSLLPGNKRINMNSSNKPTDYSVVESQYFSKNGKGYKSKVENKITNSISNKLVGGKPGTKQSDICWSDGEQDDLIIIEDPSNVTPPTVNMKPKIKNVAFVSPYAFSSSLGFLKNKIPGKKKKTKTKNTIMAGFHKQQKISQKLSRQQLSSSSTSFVSNEKKMNSIKKYFSPLPVRKMFD